MKNIITLGTVGLLLLAGSCAEFLDKKPGIKLVVPKTLADANLLLNDYGTLNSHYPTFGEMGTDDYYLTQQGWEGVNNYEQRMAYVWADEPYTDVLQWQRPYKAVYIANQVLDVLDKLKDQYQDANFKRAWGGAHFHRAFAFHHLAGIYCVAYDPATATTDLGIPLRLKPEVDQLSVRASLVDTYVQILGDYAVAIDHLPVDEVTKGRPDKAAAYAGMARTYLDMGDYTKAYNYADSCLQLRDGLMDFNTLSVSSNTPIPRFNVEVLFPALGTAAVPMNATVALMDTMLIESYAEHDLRRTRFFRPNTNPIGSFYFKGSFDQSNTLFFGITTSEVYLIKAEAGTRVGKLQEAKEALNTLLASRWDKNALYAPITETNAEQLLRIVLQERRKELVFRGRRWADLKRLNLDPRFQTTLRRVFGETTHTLPPNDPRYAFRISETVMELSGIQQNKR